ncbi:hypothetical protein ACUS6W_31895, partial [Pseudomonas aeruginosa]|uniref:hypothetical protein n=1 Tax=Pseudomonas aeruginosa TaxID=287 RepID=UPI00405409EA
SLNQTEKIDHEVQASACRIESLSEQWLTFQMNEFSPYLGMTPGGTVDTGNYLGHRCSPSQWPMS